MKKSLIAIAFAAAAGLAGNAMAAPIADGTITFNNNATDSSTDNFFTMGTGVWVAGSFIQTAPALNSDFTAGNEFRMVGPDGAVGGGGEKDIVTTTINWGTGFGGLVISSDGDMTPGCGTLTGCLGVTQGGFNNADFFGQAFGFALDPNVPVSADVNLVNGGAFTVGASSAQAQWGGVYFPLGELNAANEVCNGTNNSGCGFSMTGTINNVGTDGSFDFILRGQHNISPWEDTAGGNASASGFAGWTAQFQVAGHFTPTAVPVPAAVWLFGSGLVGLVGVARRKKV